MRERESLDCPAAPLEDDDRTPAQRRCSDVSKRECESYQRCQDCPAFVPPANRSRA